MRAPSLRRRLLMGILLPVVAFIAFNTFSLYRQALASLNTAYDRTLLASAKTISEQLDVSGYDDDAQLRAIVPYAALEAFEADNQSHMFYRVSTLQGEMVSGFAELAAWRGRIPDRPPYAALVDFYDDQFRGENVRVAVLLQPVASANGRGMAVIQVAETLEVRETLALQILWNTLARQALLIGVIALTVVIVVQRATRPVRQLSQQLQARPDGDLSPIAASSAPRELQPLIDSTCVLSTASGVRNWCDVSRTNRFWWRSRCCSRCMTWLVLSIRGCSSRGAELAAIGLRSPSGRACSC